MMTTEAMHAAELTMPNWCRKPDRQPGRLPPDCRAIPDLVLFADLLRNGQRDPERRPRPGDVLSPPGNNLRNCASQRSCGRGCAASPAFSSARSSGARAASRFMPPNRWRRWMSWLSPEPLPPDQAISDEEKAILWRSLERIPELYREPLVLFYREQQSVEAVAQDLGLSEDAVKQRLSRGRKLLQEQFLAFVAGALKQTNPGKAFTLGVVAALPLLATTAKAATVGTTLAKHGSVAAKTTSSGGVLQAISYVFMGMVGWVAAALSLGGYIGYKMGGDSQNSERARRSVATFWRITGISMFLLFCLPLLLTLLPGKVIHLSDAKAAPMGTSWINLCLPAFMFGVVPLSLVIWIWQRGRRTVPEERPTSGQAPKSVTIWVMLAMIAAIFYLGWMCWIYSHMSPSHLPQTRFLSSSEIQDTSPIRRCGSFASGCTRAPAEPAGSRAICWRTGRCPRSSRRRRIARWPCWPRKASAMRRRLRTRMLPSPHDPDRLVGPAAADPVLLFYPCGWSCYASCGEAITTNPDRIFHHRAEKRTACGQNFCRIGRVRNGRPGRCPGGNHGLECAHHPRLTGPGHRRSAQACPVRSI